MNDDDDDDKLMSGDCVCSNFNILWLILWSCGAKTGLTHEGIESSEFYRFVVSFSVIFMKFQDNRKLLFLIFFLLLL